MSITQSGSGQNDSVRLDRVYATAAQAVSILERAAKRRRADGRLFDKVRASVACLPYATDEFALANRRLDNAIAYYIRGEFGAASYELAALQRKLAQECLGDL